MHALVIEEDMRAKGAQDIRLGEPPPRKKASSIATFHCCSVRITRSCTGASRAVTRAMQSGSR